jgi:hypothetical protein
VTPATALSTNTPATTVTDELEEEAIELEDTATADDASEDALAKELEAAGDEAGALDAGILSALDSVAEETWPLDASTELAGKLLDIAATLELLLTGALLVFLELPDEPPPQATNASVMEQDIKPARYLFM